MYIVFFMANAYTYTDTQKYSVQICDIWFYILRLITDLRDSWHSSWMGDCQIGILRWKMILTLKAVTSYDRPNMQKA